MAISKTSPKQFLGAQIPNVKVLSSKIDEIIDEVNGTSGTVTQTTNRTNEVTLNATKGVITTNTTSLSTATNVVFTVNNSAVKADSVVIANMDTTNLTAYGVHFSIESITAGSFKIRYLNATGGNITTALIFNFVVN
jgi:hypothetical protein